ncbi:MAG: thioesterase family protein [Bacteroidota bacterium]
MTTPTSEVESLLQDYPVLAFRQVNWGDMDAARHVNNTVYLRWAEVGRSAFLDQAVSSWNESRPPHIGPVLAKLKCKYIYPIRYPDTVWIGTRVIERMPDRVVFENLVVSSTHQRVAAKIQAQMVMFDFKENKKAPITDAFWELMASL